MNRRMFLETATAAGGALLSTRLAWAADSHRIEKVGLQLYTVRDAMKSDFEGTIAKVAAIGYKEVEFAGYFDHTPQQVRAILDKNGLTAPSVHVDYPSLGERFPKAQFLITGVLGPHSNAHGPNEFLHVPTVKNVSACVASVIAAFGARG